MLFHLLKCHNRQFFRFLSVSAGLLLVVFQGRAEIYLWRDNSGSSFYSDRAVKGADRLSIDAGYSYYQVAHVYDGDSIQLSNGQKIRLAGINTPEVGFRDKLPEAGADSAKSWLKQRLAGVSVRLVTDQQKKDKYQRLLAHVFTRSGQHINLELVENGLAFVSLHPPNLNYSKVLLDAEQQAESRQLGLWQLTEYQAYHWQDVVNSKAKGWVRVRGKISHISIARKYVYLKYSDNFMLVFEKKNLALFSDLDQYPGHEVEARGWLRKRKNRFSVLIRHPSEIQMQ